jgi:hypothetical protein
VDPGQRLAAGGRPGQGPDRTGGGTAWTFELYHQRGDKQWKTLSFTIPAPTRDQGLLFSFVHEKLTWKLKLNKTGFDLTAGVAAKQRSQTYSSTRGRQRGRT